MLMWLIFANNVKDEIAKLSDTLITLVVIVGNQYTMVQTRVTGLYI